MPRRKEIESNGARQIVTIIRVESKENPDNNAICCNKPTESKQINYHVTLNKETFEVPDVYANVCTECEYIYFDPDVGSAIMDKIFKKQHPERAAWSDFISEDV